MRTIQLTKGYVAQVSDEVYASVMAAGPWHAHIGKRNVYARHSSRKPDGSMTHQYMQRFATAAKFFERIKWSAAETIRSRFATDWRKKSWQETASAETATRNATRAAKTERSPIACECRADRAVWLL